MTQPAFTHNNQSFHVGDTVSCLARSEKGQPIGACVGVVTKTDDGFVILTERGYRFALEGWTEYKKVLKAGGKK